MSHAIHFSATDLKLATVAISTDVAKLPCVAFAQRGAIPRNLSAVYFVMINGRVFYVGDSYDLWQRWLSHTIYKQFPSSRELMSGATIHYLAHRDIGNKQTLEHMFMLLYRPIWNERDSRLRCFGPASQKRWAALVTAANWAMIILRVSHLGGCML